MSYLIKGSITYWDSNGVKNDEVFVCPADLNIHVRIDHMVDLVLGKNLEFFDKFYWDKFFFDKEEYTSADEKIEMFEKVSSDTEQILVLKKIPQFLYEVTELMDEVHTKWVGLLFYAEIEWIISSYIEIYYQKDSDIFKIEWNNNGEDIKF